MSNCISRLRSITNFASGINYSDKLGSVAERVSSIKQLKGKYVRALTTQSVCPDLWPFAFSTCLLFLHCAKTKGRYTTWSRSPRDNLAPLQNKPLVNRSRQILAGCSQICLPVSEWKCPLEAKLKHSRCVSLSSCLNNPCRVLMTY